MDDGVSDYPSWGGLDLLSLADTEFDFVTVETEYGTLQYGSCVQNCQDRARWMVGTIDSGISLGLGPNASSVRTPGGIVVAYDDGQNGQHRVKVGTCGGVCYLKRNWTLGDIRGGNVGSFYATHSRSLAAGPAGDLSLLYRGEAGPNVYYAHCATLCTDSASWQSVLLDSGALWYFDVALTVAPSGAVHALIEGGASTALTYFTCDSVCTSRGNWNSLLLDTGQIGGTPSILVGSGGVLYASFGSQETGVRSVPIGFATCPGNCLTIGSWSFTNLPAIAGFDISLVLDASDHPWIATTYGDCTYCGGTTTVLHCAAACSTPGSWISMTIDSLGDGLDVSMALDAQMQPRVFVSGNGVHYLQRPDTSVLVPSAMPPNQRQELTRR